MIALILDLHSFITGDILWQILCLGVVDKDNSPWKTASVIFIPFFLGITHLQQMKTSTNFWFHFL